jgi:lysophospholipase L1-like esterase
MSAMNGSTVALRLSRRAAGCCVALAFALSAFVLAPVSAHAAAPPTTTYLALGDSISFGYSEERFNLHFPTESPSYFEEGFTNDFVKDLAKNSEVGKSIRLVNDACPGETSEGLIGENPEVGGEASTETLEEVEGKPAERFPAGGYQGIGDYHPCKYTFENHLPLHNGGYLNGGKEVSQLEEAISSIESKTSPVQAITLNIGSNDLLAGVTQCEDEHITEGEAVILKCIFERGEKIVAPKIVSDLADTIGVIDHVGYKGPIVLLGFYNPNAFVLPKSDLAVEALNKAIETELLPGLAEEGITNVAYANPFSVFNAGAPTTSSEGNGKAELKAICKFTEMCNPNDPGGKSDDGDIHPSPTGYKELGKLVNKAYLELVAKGV